MIDVESSEGSEPEEEQIVTPAKKSAKKQNITLKKKLPKKHEKTVEAVTISSDSESDAEVPAVANKKKVVSKTPPRRSTRSAISQPVTITLDSDDDLALPPPKATRANITRSKRPFQRTSSASKSMDTDEDDNDPIVSSPKRSQRPIFKNKVDTSESETDEDEIQSSNRRRRPRVEAIPTPTDDDEQDEEEVAVSPLKRKKPVEFDSESDIVESPAKRQRNVQSSEDSDSDNDLQIPSRNQRPAPARRSESPQRITRQARTRRHRTEKEKTLELMKRRRAGEKISKLTDTESSGDDDENEPEFEELSEFDDEDEEEVVKPRKSGKKGEVQDDDDFIVEDDDDDPLGVPMHMIPLEFTHQAHKPLKEHFRDAIEWMVHKKLNPAFPKDDPVYDQAFRKLETECSGLAKSKFSSTAWTTAFTHALYARPFFVSGDLEEGEGYDLVTGLPKCDACNHRSHVPTKFIQFTGKAYSKNSLDEIDQNNEDSEGNEWDSDDSDRIEVNEKGLKLPAEKTKWFVGRHCFANAEQSHTLIHWRFALYEWVKDTLEQEGELAPAKLEQRERMKARKRTKYANDLVDRWAGENQIKDLYRDFKNQVATARDLQQGKRGAWV